MKITDIEVIPIHPRLAKRYDNAAGRAAGQRHGDELAVRSAALGGLGLLGVVSQRAAVDTVAEIRRL